VFFDKLKGLKLAVVINGSCFRLSYCRILLKSLLVLAVLLLAYVLVGVAPASAFTPTTLDIAVVRGLDNGIYWSAYDSFGFWGSWQSLNGATLSPPGICEAVGIVVVVRGMDNGIYFRSWSSGGGWLSWGSPPGGGATIDTPACAYLPSTGLLYVVVRGTTNELYWNSVSSGGWSGWQDLHGASASAPVLVATTPGRLDLVVQGTSNVIWHKALIGGVWATNWDSPGGATPSKPAAAFATEVTGCSPTCVETDALIVVVRGMDNNVYYVAQFIGLGWYGWVPLSGQTLSAPTLAYYANGCTPGTTSVCNSVEALAVRGTNNALYHKTLTTAWSTNWDSPGGSISNSPALAYVPGSAAQFLLLVEGYPSIYSNTVTGSTWTGYYSVGGATNSDPALVAVV
jgi:hypothetical protein